MASVPRTPGPAHCAAVAHAAGAPAAHADIHAHRILILDFGAQYTQLIARRVRELGVYCEIHPWDMSDAQVRAFAPRAVILSGGPESVTDQDPPRAPAAVFELGVPVLGICYGMQTMAQQLGGRVAPSTEREFGYAEVTVTAPSRLLEHLEDRRDAAGHALLDVWMSHGDRVAALPAGFTACAATSTIPFAAMSDERRRFYGVQFHPEVTHTKQGARLLERFVREICRERCAVEHRQHHRGRDSPGARHGRYRQGAARPLGRRRLLGGRGAAAPGDRRTAHLRVRRPRAAASRGGRAGDAHLRRAPRRARDPRGRRRALPRSARRRHRPGAEAQDHRPHLHRGVRRGGARARGRRIPGAGHDLPRRDRIRRRAAPARRTSSSRITTSAACPST